MAKGNSVIQLWTATVGDAAASIDMQDDGSILRAMGFLDLTSVAADGDGAQAELSFGSTNALSTNDARQVVARINHTSLFGTAVGFGLATSHQQFDYGEEGLPFFGGERLYIHTSNVLGGLMTRCSFLIVVSFKGGPVSRRR